MPDTHLGEAGVLGAGVPQDPALEPFAVLYKIIVDISPNKHLLNPYEYLFTNSKIIEL